MRRYSSGVANRKGIVCSLGEKVYTLLLDATNKFAGKGQCRKEKNMKRKIAAAVVIIMASMWTLAGCHTMKGVGEDVQSGGKAIENSSGR
jgi:entericidin B